MPRLLQRHWKVLGYSLGCSRNPSNVKQDGREEPYELGLSQKDTNHRLLSARNDGKSAHPKYFLLLVGNTYGATGANLHK